MYDWHYFTIGLPIFKATWVSLKKKIYNFLNKSQFMIRKWYVYILGHLAGAFVQSDLQ